jgi:hypothetical protein
MSIKLSDLQTGPDFVKLLLIGASGAGKTVSTASFPGKKLILDFDNKVSSISQFYKGNPLLAEIEVKQYGKMTIKPNVAGVKPRMQQFLDDMGVFFKMHDAKQKLPFDTIIVDTITTLVDSIMEDYRYVSQLGVKRPNQDQNSQSDYGLLATHFKQIIGRLLALDANVVFVGHSKLETDESTGIRSNEILMPGQMASKLGIYFEEVYFAKLNAKNERVWQTVADSKTVFCRTQRRNMPSEIPANYAEIVKERG